MIESRIGDHTKYVNLLHKGACNDVQQTSKIVKYDCIHAYPTNTCQRNWPVILDHACLPFYMQYIHLRVSSQMELFLEVKTLKYNG